MLGIKTGVGLSNGDCYMNGKLVPSPGTTGILTNFNGGVTLNLKIKERWFFHSEILFEDKGNRRVNHSFILIGNNVNGDSIPRTQVIRNHMFYLHFPQTVRFLIPLDRKEKNSIYFEAGPYFACYLISKDVVITTDSYSRTRNSDFHDMTETIGAEEFSRQRLDWGITAGLGYVLKLWKGQLDFNIKFDHMLQPFAKDLYLGSKAYQYVIATTIGYDFPVLQKAYK
ncbi:MAG: outer membrane beta-barrel protein [Bacteroidetes bacterium]|nr:outer membrane beta-barrel protein [Bacteroidota bacterium]